MNKERESRAALENEYNRVLPDEGLPVEEVRDAPAERTTLDTIIPL